MTYPVFPTGHRPVNHPSGLPTPNVSKHPFGSRPFTLMLYHLVPPPVKTIPLVLCQLNRSETTGSGVELASSRRTGSGAELALSERTGSGVDPTVMLLAVFISCRLPSLGPASSMLLRAADVNTDATLSGGYQRSLRSRSSSSSRTGRERNTQAQPDRKAQRRGVGEHAAQDGCRG